MANFSIRHKNKCKINDSDKMKIGTLTSQLFSQNGLCESAPKFAIWVYACVCVCVCVCMYVCDWVWLCIMNLWYVSLALTYFKECYLDLQDQINIPILMVLFERHISFILAQVQFCTLLHKAPCSSKREHILHKNDTKWFGIKHSFIWCIILYWWSMIYEIISNFLSVKFFLLTR